MRADKEMIVHQLHNLLTQSFDIGCLWDILFVVVPIARSKQSEATTWTHKHLNDFFDDAIWMDECTVQIKSHRRFYLKLTISIFAQAY